MIRVCMWAVIGSLHHGLNGSRRVPIMNNRLVFAANSSGSPTEGANTVADLNCKKHTQADAQRRRRTHTHRQDERLERLHHTQTVTRGRAERIRPAYWTWVCSRSRFQPLRICHQLLLRQAQEAEATDSHQQSGKRSSKEANWKPKSK